MTIKVPHALLDAIMAEFQLKNDAALSNFLELPPPHISRMRHVRYGISAEMILRTYDKTGWSIEKIRSYLRGPE